MNIMKLIFVVAVFLMIFGFFAIYKFLVRKEEQGNETNWRDLGIAFILFAAVLLSFSGAVLLKHGISIF